MPEFYLWVMLGAGIVLSPVAVSGPYTAEECKALVEPTLEARAAKTKSVYSVTCAKYAPPYPFDFEK